MGNPSHMVVGQGQSHELHSKGVMVEGLVRLVPLHKDWDLCSTVTAHQVDEELDLNA
jgi:hypothetical protein